MKICTFKVDTAARGKKLGERLLFIVFDYCVKNDVDWTYLHTFGKEQRSLVALCEEYGFSFLGKYKKDDVYIKPMKLALTTHDSLTSLIIFYPFFQDNDTVQRFILPIRPNYHEDLFPDFGSLKGSLFEDDQNLYSCQGNTIKKAYLCHSNTKTVKKGDIILFYRSFDKKSIQCMGVVEDTLISNKVDEVFPLVAKRTVYTYSDLVRILAQKTLIILFRFIPIDHEISREKILSVGIKGNIQSIRKISREQYIALNI